MNLKEKFINSPDADGFINTNESRAENNVKIAENFAVQFFDWIKRCKLTKSELPTNVLLKMFKNQNHL